MDKPRPISPTDLYLELGTAGAPALIDVRTGPTFDADDRLIIGARRLPESPDQWKVELKKSQRFVVYGSQGDQTSRGVAEALCELGQEASYLDGGFAAWLAQGLPTRRQLTTGPKKWITRERPKIDRIACPWLIRRFIDPEADFIYVPGERVLAEAKVLEAIPYDIPDVEFTHEGERCSFDTFLRIYDIADPPLDQLALIVRGADTSRHDLAPQCGGLFAISLGLSANFPDDYAMLEHGMVIYDALYTWCRSLQAETHGWPPKA
jgi:rhodanese-related sulfurtransferase